MAYRSVVVIASAKTLAVEIWGLTFFSAPTTQEAEITLYKPVERKTLINGFDFDFNKDDPFNEEKIHVTITDYKQNDYIVFYSCFESIIGKAFFGMMEYAWILHRNHTMNKRAIEEIEQRLLTSISDRERKAPLLDWTWKNKCNKVQFATQHNNF